MKLWPSFKNIFTPQHSVDDTTLDQILDAVSGINGDFPVFDDSVGGRRNMRNRALQSPTLSRCITLISGVMAQLITGGTLRVIDRDGRVAEDMNAQRAIDLFTTSLDGMTDSHALVEDMCVDYLTEGNFLAHLERSANGRVTGISRLISYAATTIPTQSGGWVYKVQFADKRIGEEQVIAPSRVAHGRWPRLFRQTSGTSDRLYFAPSPISLMHPSLQIALAGDKFIREWYDQGMKSNFAILLERRLSGEQSAEFQEMLSKSRKNQAPLILGDKPSIANLNSTPISESESDLRGFQVSEISRIYGVPGPLLNQNLTSWGQGIEELAKIFWRFGVSQHCNRFMAPFNFRMLRPGQRFVMDPVDLLRGDNTAMANLLNATRRDAQRDEVLTIEEQRRMLGYPVAPENGVLQSAAENSMDES